MDNNRSKEEEEEEEEEEMICVTCNYEFIIGCGLFSLVSRREFWNNVQDS